MGEILIGLSETEAGTVSLTVADQGVGIPKGFDWKKSKSMGLSIAHLLAQQIEGKLSIAKNPGAAFTVEFPKQFKETKSATA